MDLGDLDMISICPYVSQSVGGEAADIYISYLSYLREVFQDPPPLRSGEEAALGYTSSRYGGLRLAYCGQSWAAHPRALEVKHALEAL